MACSISLSNHKKLKKALRLATRLINRLLRTSSKKMNLTGLSPKNQIWSFQHSPMNKCWKLFQTLKMSMSRSVQATRNLNRRTLSKAPNYSGRKAQSSWPKTIFKWTKDLCLNEQKTKQASKAQTLPSGRKAIPSLPRKFNKIRKMKSTIYNLWATANSRTKAMPSDVKIRTLMQTGCNDFPPFLFIMLNSIACPNTFLDKSNGQLMIIY